MDAIVVKNVGYRYKTNDYYSLKNINLTIKSDSCTGIIGPNGAGKSTLISILSGLLPDYTGEVKYPISAESDLVSTVKKHVSLVPQEYAFYPQLSVEQNLEYFSSLCREIDSQKALSDIIQQCQLNDVLDKKAGRISGGYKRRLNIAIALVKKPDVLFLDEPTVGIDPESRDVVVNLLEQLKDEGKTLIFTSHMLEEVERLCDSVVVLKNGEAIGQQEEAGQHRIIKVSLKQGHKVELPDIFQPSKINNEFYVPIHNDLEYQNVMEFCLLNGNDVTSIDYSAHSIDSLYRTALKKENVSE